MGAIVRSQANAVTSFRRLHAGERVLLLPNVWDAGSAALFAAVGAAAVATTSAGLAWACGFADGGALPRTSLMFAVGSIGRVVGDIPLTVDIEGGYANEPDGVADVVSELLALGVAGINIEDATGAPDLLAAKIAAIKRRVRDNGADVFINARTDVYLRELACGEDAERETVSRAQLYARAGADGIFVPDLSDPSAIRRIANATALPLNLTAVPGLPPFRELHALGVRRVSAGASIAKSAYGTARRIAASFLLGGDSGVLFADDAVDYGEMNALLEKAATARE